MARQPFDPAHLRALSQFASQTGPVSAAARSALRYAEEQQRTVSGRNLFVLQQMAAGSGPQAEAARAILRSLDQDREKSKKPKDHWLGLMQAISLGGAPFMSDFATGFIHGRAIRNAFMGLFGGRKPPEGKSLMPGAGALPQVIVDSRQPKPKPKRAVKPPHPTGIPIGPGTLGATGRYKPPPVHHILPSGFPTPGLAAATPRQARPAPRPLPPPGTARPTLLMPRTAAVPRTVQPPPPPAGPLPIPASRQRRAVPTMLSPLTPSRGNAPRLFDEHGVEDDLAERRRLRAETLSYAPPRPPRSTVLQRTSGGPLIPLKRRPTERMVPPTVLPEGQRFGQQRHTRVALEESQRHTRVNLGAPKTALAGEKGMQEQLLAEIVDTLKGQANRTSAKDVDAAKLPDLFHDIKAVTLMNRSRG